MLIKPSLAGISVQDIEVIESKHLIDNHYSTLIQPNSKKRYLTPEVFKTWANWISELVHQAQSFIINDFCVLM